jgi:6-phosphogluconolactonase (cycloisomerase 2 family)
MSSIHRLRSLAARSALTLAVLASFTATARAEQDHGAVYVLSNQVASNSILVFDRAHDGTLAYATSVPTGGTGTGPLAASGAPFLDPLGSQGSLVLHDGLLFAVNAGSDEISLFRADERQPVLVDKVASGGVKPVSIAVRGFFAYVLNQGSATTAPNVTGFVIDPVRNRLVPLGVQAALAGGTLANPAEVHFSASGDVLIVTEKGTNLIDTYRVGYRGELSSPGSIASSGSTPFGFSVTRDDVVVVSDAASGAATSYALRRDGTLSPVSGPVSNGGQAAPCWLVTTRDGRYAYEANAGSSTLSSFAVGPGGALTLLDDAAASVGGGLLDLAFDEDGRFLYVRDGSGTIAAYRVHGDGSLSSAGTLPSGSLPTGAQGIAAR